MALITWRLAVLFVLDGGPFGVLEKIRAGVIPEIVIEDFPNDHFRADIEHRIGGAPLLGGAISCVGCFSLWMAPVAFLVVRHGPEELALVLSAWSGATLAHRALS